MKKFVTAFLALMMVFGMSISAFATESGVGGFISSPPAQTAPELVEAENESEDCFAELIITAYANRNDISEEARQALERAYAEIRGTKDLTTLCAALAELAAAKGINPTDLAVSDLFDISCVGCDDHDDHGHFSITLKAETLKGFVALLHYYNGEWTIVEGAEVTHNGDHLEFDEKEFSPFAIVVNTADIADAPQTGDTRMVYLYVVLMVAAAVVFVVLAKGRKSKKQSA